MVLRPRIVHFRSLSAASRQENTPHLAESQETSHLAVRLLSMVTRSNSTSYANIMPSFTTSESTLHEFITVESNGSYRCHGKTRRHLSLAFARPESRHGHVVNRHSPCCSDSRQSFPSLLDAEMAEPFALHLGDGARRLLDAEDRAATESSRGLRETCRNDRCGGTRINPYPCCRSSPVPISLDRRAE
jgi:hypothetical protein